MFEILTVCTGNICRSPLAEQLLRTRLAPLEVRVQSAGTRGLNSAPMTPEAVEVAVRLGVDERDATSHRSHFLTERDLVSPDLILTMARDHRREVAELAPSRLRNTFTIREFARITRVMPIGDLQQAVSEGRDPAARVRAIGVAVASHRGLVAPPDDPAEDDVIDPFRRSRQTYDLSASQLEPAVDEVVRVLQLSLAPQIGH